MKGIPARVLAALAAVVLSMVGVSAYADPLIATKEITAWPTVGETVQLGYGDVTSLTCIGESFEEGEVWFTYHLEDTWNVFGNPIDAGEIKCIDHDLAAEGGRDGGDQGWPVEWVGRNTRIKMSATVTDVDTETGTVTYTVLAYHVRYYKIGIAHV